jgi:hypothetical protein
MTGKKLRATWRIGGGMLVLAAACVWAPLAAAQVTRQPRKVEVVNTSASPVPTVAVGTTAVTGIVTIDNASSSPVPVSGGVTVANPESSPIPALVVNDRAVTPWHRRVQIDLPDGTRNSLTAFSVPTGQRLVAEDVSISCFVPATQHIVHVRIDYGLASVPPSLFLPVADQGQLDAQHFFMGNQHTHLYFEGGTTLLARAFRDDTVGTAGCVMTVSGYLVSMP